MTIYRPSQRWQAILPVLVIIVASSLAFLPLIGKLGYYHDDWFTTAARVSGVGLEQMHSIDRPLMGTYYSVLSGWLGEAPLAWHLFTWFIRTLSGLLVWVMVRLLFPERDRLAVGAAVLFVVYPGFLQQPSANNYANHWVAIFLALVSITLTLRAALAKEGSELLLLTLLAAPLVMEYARIYETFIGFEALRILFVAYICIQQPIPKKQKWLRAMIVLALPLFAGMYFLYWRFFIFNSVRVSTDETALLGQLLTDPVTVLRQVSLGLASGFWNTGFSAWLEPLLRLWSRAPIASRWLGVVLGVVTSLIAWLGLIRIKEDDKPRKWAPIWVGALGLLLTLIPVLMVGRYVGFTDYMDRYTLQSILPAALMLAGLAGMFGRRASGVLVGSLAGFAVVFNIVNAGIYAANWQVQQSLWWQMSWRAPQLADGTNLIVYFPPGYRYPEEFEVWAPANRIYSDKPGPLRITAALLGEDTLAEVLQGGQVERDFRTIQYKKDYSRSLVISQPSLTSCIHVLDGSQPLLGGNEPMIIRQVAFLSNLNQIAPSNGDVTPPKVIFGREPEHGWCYYYQKTDLAVQHADYRTAVQYADEAIGLGLSPADFVEWMPFYRAYAYAGRTADAIALAEKIQMDSAFTADYCARFDLPTLALQSNMEAFITINLCMPELSK